MPLNIRLTLDPAGIDAAARQLEAYANKLPDIAERIAKGLADKGYQVAYSILAGHVFDGETISSLMVTNEGNGQFLLSASSRAILFLEFGAGMRYAAPHPWASEQGMGAGTYPGQTHADDPNGWWFPTDDPRLIVRRGADGQGWGHSYGMPPYMPFYRSSEEMRRDILEVARSVFASA